MRTLYLRGVAAAAGLLIAAAALVALAAPAAGQTAEQKLPYTAAATRDPDTQATTIGTKFTVAKAGKVVGVEFFRVDSQNKATTVQLWGPGSTALATASGAPSSIGWVRANFATPVAVTAGTTYTASYFAPSGKYSVKSQGWVTGRTAGDLTAPIGAGLYRYGSTAGKPTSTYQNEDYYVTPVFIADVAAPSTTTTVAPPPTSTTTTPPPTTTTPPPPPPPGAFPDGTNTGVPAGTTLTPYDGPCGIREVNVVIENKTINCDLAIYQPGLVIRKSKVNGVVIVNAPAASVTVEDSGVDGGQGQIATVGDRNATITRSNIHGGQHAVQCYGNCTVRDSWLHDTWPGGKALDWHENAFISNGGSNMLIQHNTLHCTGGCTADLALIPDDDLSNITIDNNLIVASPDSAYCLYGGGATPGKPGTNDHIVVTNNVWQKGANGKCATYGPVTSMDLSRPGNVWTNNKWDDGTVLDPVF